MIHTLALISLVLLASFALAASSLSQLNLSSRYAQRTQADYTARAAMTEFVIRARSFSTVHDVTSGPVAIFPKFQSQPILLENQPRVAGRVRLLLDSCVDNGGNSLPGRSHFDPPGKTSVPPFSLSVVYEVVLGSRTYTYESLVQQRWPYALVAPGPVFIPGRVGPALDGAADVTGLPPTFWSAPSEVKGRVLGLQTDITADIDEHRAGESHAGNLVNPVKVSMGAYEALAPYAYSGGLVDTPTNYIGLATGAPTSSSTLREDSDSRLIVGGGYKITKMTLNGVDFSKGGFVGSLIKGYPTSPNSPPTKPGGSPRAEVGPNTDEKGRELLDYLVKGGGLAATVYNVNTTGAIIHRGVDLAENAPPSGDGFTTQSKVTIKPGNKVNGKTRYDYRVNGQNPSDNASREQMRKLFTKPETGAWPANRFNRDKEIIITRDPAPANPVSPSGLPTPPTYIQASSGYLRYPGNFEHPVGYAIGSAAFEAYSAAMGESLGLPEGYNVQGSLTLQDVSLAVDGDFCLQNYVLKGSHATLIVDGTLTLDGGYLDAGDNSMVIFCRRLIMKAQGNYNGLIVAEKGAALYGAGAASAPAAPGLHIRGGLLVGGTDLLVVGDPTQGVTLGSVSNKVLASITPLQMRGLMLSSCKLEYEPRYLHGLNNFGNYEVLATELRQ